MAVWAIRFPHFTRLTVTNNCMRRFLSYHYLESYRVC